MFNYRNPLRCVLESLAILAIAIFLSIPAIAAEIDSLTDRHLPLRDSRVALQNRFNKALQAAVKDANRSAMACDKEALYDAVRAALASPFIGHRIAEQLNEDETLDRSHVFREDSIYQDLGWLQNPSVHVKDLSAVLRIGDTMVGVDKLGHFFVEGWRYFEKAVVKDKGIDKALAWGEFTERTYFGNYTTGVFAFADLVANFEGLRFWLRLTGEATDPIAAGGRENRPYVGCGHRFWLFGERQWRLQRKLRLTNYVSPVWDEAVNCPAFRSPKIEARVQERIAALETGEGVDYTCPVKPGACALARKRYGKYAERLLHPDCLKGEMAM